MRPSMSICTPRAFPSSGRNSEYGKLVPTINSVSQPVISSQLGRVPRRPIVCRQRYVVARWTCTLV